MDYYSFCNGLIFDSFLHNYVSSLKLLLHKDRPNPGGETQAGGGTKAGGGVQIQELGETQSGGESQYTPSVCNPAEGGRRRRRRRKRDEVRK